MDLALDPVAGPAEVLSQKPDARLGVSAGVVVPSGVRSVFGLFCSVFGLFRLFGVLGFGVLVWCRAALLALVGFFDCGCNMSARWTANVPVVGDSNHEPRTDFSRCDKCGSSDVDFEILFGGIAICRPCMVVFLQPHDSGHDPTASPSMGPGASSGAPAKYIVWVAFQDKTYMFYQLTVPFDVAEIRRRMQARLFNGCYIDDNMITILKHGDRLSASHVFLENDANV